MGRHIAAIVLIFFLASVAWLVLGATIFLRTENSDRQLKSQVVSTWGSMQEQRTPRATYWGPETPQSLEAAAAAAAAAQSSGNRQVSGVIPYSSTTPVPDATNTRIVAPGKREAKRALPLDQTRVQATIDLEHRQKGLLWYSTYAVAFNGEWTFRNDSGAAQDVTLAFQLPAERAIYDGLEITADGQPLATQPLGDHLFATVRMPAGANTRLGARYRSQGLDRWTYHMGGVATPVRDFDMKLRTNFKRVDFPMNSLSPTTRTRQGNGWELAWKYQNLVSGYPIALAMPARLQPGPVAGRISLFAPVALLFFFFLMFIITTLRGIDLHPMNYFFLAAAFFAFHLLLAYLVDWIPLGGAFAIASAVSVFLVVSYLRLVVGMRFAAVEAGLTQLVYLVGFSAAFFLEGMTGLAITIGSVLTLFIVMQLTGRIRWGERFARGRERGPAGAVIPERT
ncbi:MAG: inner membrane CreD family protein [Candidatus Eiseniibacteriota bacterium]